MNRPVPATLGGFTIGFATGLLGGTLQPQVVDSFIFSAVVVVLLIRADEFFTRTRTVERVNDSSTSRRWPASRPRRCRAAGTTVSLSTQSSPTRSSR